MGGWRGSLGARRVEMREMEQCGETEVETTDKKGRKNKDGIKRKEKKDVMKERRRKEKEGKKQEEKAVREVLSAG